MCARLFVYCVCPCVHEYIIMWVTCMSCVCHACMLCVMSMVVVELPLSSFCWGLLTNSQLKFTGSSSPSVGMIIKELNFLKESIIQQLFHKSTEGRPSRGRGQLNIKMLVLVLNS